MCQVSQSDKIFKFWNVFLTIDVWYAKKGNKTKRYFLITKVLKSSRSGRYFEIGLMIAVNIFML